MIIFLIFILVFLGYIGYLAYQWHVSDLIAKTRNLSNRKAEMLTKQAKHIKRLKYNQ